MSARPAPRLRWIALAAMTLANSMILVDQTAVPLALPDAVLDLGAESSLGQWILTANVLPLAAFMVLGGRLGDLLGLKRVFLTGAVIYIVSSALAGAAQSIEWLIAVRATQGIGAALMMPTSVAIVAGVFPDAERGRALGLLAGASAFFAALGPVVGGALTELDWRAVFFINVPLAVVTIVLALVAVPELTRPARTRIDFAGAVVLAIGLGALVFGFSQSQAEGWVRPDVIVPIIVGAIGLVAFLALERRVHAPLIDLPLFRHLNFTAANVSQTLAGMIELGMGFVMPYYLLLALELDPASAGLALLPATVPIILAGPLAGRAFDKVGGRIPMAVGFLTLAASGLWLAFTVGEQDLLLIVPGLILQGIGLGIVLTVNDPVGLSSVPEKERGEAAGVINTSEQLGGALGIALLGSLMIGTYRANLDDIVTRAGETITRTRGEELKAFLLHSEQTGLDPDRIPPSLRRLVIEAGDAFLDAFALTMLATVIIALVGAAVTFIWVRRGDPVKEGRIFSRRSRWAYSSTGHGAGLTKRPIPRGPTSAPVPASPDSGGA